MLKRARKLVVLLAAFALIAAACGDDDDAAEDTTTTAAEETTTTAAEETTTTTEGEETTTTTEAMMDVTPVKTCLLTDLPPGLDDRSFNAGAWQGVLDAEAAGFATDILALESITAEDYQPNLDQMYAQGCEHIVTVGFLLGAITAEQAALHPEINWTIVDFFYEETIPNVRELAYQTDEAAFAAGYLAAGMSQSGIIGTFGGANIPTVSIFMDGLTRGVAYYNEQKGTSVEVRGWDVEAQDGLFIGSFDDFALARDFADNLLDEGADIILPVGGRINLPAGDAIADRGVDASLIGVDVDNFVSMPEQYQPVWLTTIEKALALQVARSIEDHATGMWEPGLTLGTLENGAVSLAPFHDWADDVPAELAAEVEQLLQDIAAGTITAGTFPVTG